MKLFRILITPGCWMRSRPTNKVLDAWMIQALKKPEFSKLSEYSVFLNGKKIWIKNYPYAFGNLYDYGNWGLPSRSTVFSLFDAICAYSVATSLEAGL